MRHCGDPAEARRPRPLSGAATPLLDLLGPLPYPVQNTLLDPGFPKGARDDLEVRDFKEITAETVSIMVERFAETPSIMTGMVIEDFHGAVTRVSPTATGVPHREPGFNLVIPARVARRQRRRRQYRLGERHLRRACSGHCRLQST